MKRVLLVLCFGLIAPLPVWSAGSSSATVPTAPLQPAKSKAPVANWSLEVLHPHLAAGAKPDDLHRSSFVVRALDANGVPLPGLPVALPKLRNVDGDVSQQTTREPLERLPQVEWSNGFDTAFTDSNGEVRGLFTSGTLDSPVTLQGPGNTEATVEQVWEDQSNWPASDTINLKVQRQDALLPVQGHYLKLLLDTVTLSVLKPTGIMGENGEPQMESVQLILKRPKANASYEEKARWAQINSWFEIQEDMQENEPGIYAGKCSLREVEHRLLGDLQVESVDDYDFMAEDQGVWTKQQIWD